MEEDFFPNKIYCELAIVSDTIAPEQLTRNLNVLPDRFFSKGDTFKSKHSGSVVTRPYNLWAVSSDVTISDKQDVGQHILYLKSLFGDSFDKLTKLKEDDRLELTLWFWLETEDAGAGFDIAEYEMAFVCSIANKVSFSVISNIEKENFKNPLF